jgi:hypothetical protein
MVPLALMLLMLIASAWLEPARGLPPEGCASGLTGQWSTVCRGNGWAKGCRSLAGQTINRYSPGGIEQIVADLHLRRDNRHTGPAQLRNVRRHPLTAEPEQGIESGDRQAGVQRLAESLPGRLYLPGNLLVRGRRQPVASTRRMRFARR